jgi:hypothetical protein
MSNCYGYGSKSNALFDAETRVFSENRRVEELLNPDDWSDEEQCRVAEGVLILQNGGIHPIPQYKFDALRKRYPNVKLEIEGDGRNYGHGR